ncbi:MAG: methyltransferase domain-containing protein [Rhodobacter sp.]|jgi:predicted TPR repeat methyltransferase|nr:methyltransferase domain-containing protein [Rhodobacter sp.]
MTEKKFLNEVYDLASPDATRKLYDSWSASYDAEIAENGYATPARVAEALARHVADTSAPILDFGCGTGLSGVALKLAGFQVIDGADLSADMLKGAKAKGVYRKLWQVEAGAQVPAGYGAITATGVIGVGAAPPEAFDQIMAALAPGGRFALSFNDHALADPVFEGKLHSYTDTGKARLLFQEYGTHLPGIDLKSNVYVFEKT